MSISAAEVFVFAGVLGWFDDFVHFFPDYLHTLHSSMEIECYHTGKLPYL